MASSSSPFEIEKKKFDQHARILRDSKKKDQLPVISDDKMFHEESKTCNLIKPLIRSPCDGDVYFDDVYILHHLRLERNKQNQKIMDYYDSSGKRNNQNLQELIKTNFETINMPIKKFWNYFRQSDFDLTKYVMFRTGFSFKSLKAIVFPAYMGDVESKDTSKSHVVLFVLYLHKTLRQIWMYDSMIENGTIQSIPRFDYQKKIKNFDLLKFKTNEKNYNIFIQKTFHLLESYAHCLELHSHMKKQNTKSSIDYDDDTMVFMPKKYSFFTTGYGKTIHQKNHDCSNFASYGMYDIMYHWKNFDKPHLMTITRYNQIYLRPMITIEQYISCHIHYFILRAIISRKSFDVKNISMFVTSDSDIIEDHDLASKIYQNLLKSNQYYIQYQKELDFKLLHCDLDALNDTSLKHVVIFICDRSYKKNNHQSYDFIEKMIKIHSTTKYFIMIFPGQCIQIFFAKNQYINAIFNEENIKITYPMPIQSTEISRDTDDLSTLQMIKNLRFSEKIGSCHVNIELPPLDVKCLQKGIDCNFIPFLMN